MELNNEINDANETVSVTIRMDAEIHRAVKSVADAEDRSLTKQIERLLKASPQVVEILEAQPAASGVTA